MKIGRSGENITTQIENKTKCDFATVHCKVSFTNAYTVEGKTIVIKNCVSNT